MCHYSRVAERILSGEVRIRFAHALRFGTDEFSKANGVFRGRNACFGVVNKN